MAKYEITIETNLEGNPVKTVEIEVADKRTAERIAKRHAKQVLEVKRV